MEYILREYTKHREWHFGYDSLFSRVRIAFLFLNAWIRTQHYICISFSTPLSGFTGLNTLLGQGISGSGREVRRLGCLSGTKVEFPMQFWSCGIA